jgi:hypothetical protein
MGAVMSISQRSSRCPRNGIYAYRMARTRVVWGWKNLLGISIMLVAITPDDDEYSRAMVSALCLGMSGHTNRRGYMEVRISLLESLRYIRAEASERRRIITSLESEGDEIWVASVGFDNIIDECNKHLG